MSQCLLILAFVSPFPIVQPLSYYLSPFVYLFFLPFSCVIYLIFINVNVKMSTFTFKLLNIFYINFRMIQYLKFHNI